MTPAPVLELRHATLVRGGARVLDDVTLSIHVGEHTAIVGPNGAGKSSLIRLLTREDYPLTSANGEPPIRLFGLENWDIFELRTQMGIVSPDLHSRFVEGAWVARSRAIDAVLSGFFASQAVFDHHAVTPEMRQQAADALDKVGVAHLASKRLNEVSWGEARRVLIARALVTTPRVLVLDEPTAGLDVVARHQFMERVRQLTREGTTLVLVTQHIDEIIPEIGRVILLQGGRVADDGPKDAVLRGRPLEKVFGAPLAVTQAGGYYHVRPA